MLQAVKKVPVMPATILVVEDDINVGAVMEARLESFGYKVCEIARTGLKAIEGQERHQPDLVLMDIQMPQMDGVTATSSDALETPHINFQRINPGTSAILAR